MKKLSVICLIVVGCVLLTVGCSKKENQAASELRNAVEESQETYMEALEELQDDLNEIEAIMEMLDNVDLDAVDVEDLTETLDTLEADLTEALDEAEALRAATEALGEALDNLNFPSN